MTTPMSIPFATLEKITNGFSNDLIIGRGGYGNVYKAVYKGEVIAVKLLHDDLVQLLDDRQFKNELFNLLRVEHPNIVCLRGYCYETRYKIVKHNGETVFGKHIHRVLCFEYLEGGSLDNHLHAPSLPPNWTTRYNTIKGICEGLNFLHGCQPPILHLDLKPANILVDSSMVPKLADFGLSKLFHGSHTHVTKQIIGTQKYMPPEFIKDGKISVKNDVFSLGIVIIEIMAGPMGYSEFSEMGSGAQFVKEVLTNWSTIIKATSEYPAEELHQVNLCIDIAMLCVDSERVNRPTIAGILDALNRTKTHMPSSTKKTHIPWGQLEDVPLCSTIGPKSTSKRSNPVPTKENKRLKMMTTEVDNIANKHQQFNCMPGDSSKTIVQQVPDRETSSDVEPTLIIGRDEEKHKILSILSESNAEEMTILPIYGIGGIGKTTLAQLVFNDIQFRDYYRVWVYVSQKFDLKKIGNFIISQLTKETSDIDDQQTLHNRLRQLFAGKSILIVLDDLWEEKQHELEKLKAMLRLGIGNKVVIVTTRDEAIARKINRTVMPYKLEILTDDMCWSIIKQKSFFEDRCDKEQLGQIGMDIAIKCGGVALAAQSLGYMLREMESDQWESVRDSYIWNLSTMEDPSLRNHEVLLSLLLSYSHMHEFLQLCFSYCAFFPKGQNIVKYDLIHQWIALGFTGPSGIFDSIQLCEKYITRLLGMSFLQYSKTRSSDERQDKDVKMFVMHDLVHDLARAILADKVNKEGDAVGSSCHYALLTDCSKPLQLSVSSTEYSRFNFFLSLFKKKSSHENIKALRFLNCGKVLLRGDAFSPAKFLLVLDLSECFIQKLSLDSIGQLRHLRYLCAPRVNDYTIPNCITKLSELTYLNLRGSCRISALPESIGDMKSLMHLDLSGCCDIIELPVSFAKLKQLVHLDLSHCHVSVSEDFGGFTKLQYLNLSVLFSSSKGHRRGLLEVIGNLKKLRYLNLSRCMEDIATSENQIGSLLDSISTLSNLEHLDLSENKQLSSIPESMGNLRKLHTLDLLGCYQLEKLPDSMINMVSLKVLNVGNLVTLDESVLSLLNIASLPHFVVHASSGKCSSNITRLQATNPDRLIIDRLENVKSAEEAHNIKLIEKQKIETLQFEWTVAARRFVDDKEVLEKLVPPSSVDSLCIIGYRSVSIPDWLLGISQYLPNLAIISLVNFSKCKNLPPLGQLPNLQWLTLSSMDGLEEWNTTYTTGEQGRNELLFPKLERLNIHDCAKLRIEPCLPRALYLRIRDSNNVLSSLNTREQAESTLPSDIAHCNNMISACGKSSSYSGASSSSPITDLFVEESKLPLHQWRLLHQLPALRGLRIKHCSDLTTSLAVIQKLSSLQNLSLELNDHELPSWLIQLTDLQELKLMHCNSITSLPQWFGELASLKRIEIKYCKGISSLPESIQQLTKLEFLSIHGCPVLEEWCESEENKMKLTHIKVEIAGRDSVGFEDSKVQIVKPMPAQMVRQSAFATTERR
uniref:Tsn1 n=1 Tax=Triticum turgidum subsp. dicoccum TaxID=49225 RepID=D7PDC4_TRITU|nr:Tsn1 [Triticum turgidum subsp. dicoccum]ADH59450.1 Tsn1 [Triticum turgidum subsp. dicoccum]